MENIEFEEINEPLSEYFNSEKFLKEYKKVTISSFVEEDNENLLFSLRLKPSQRLEYLYILNERFLYEHIKKLPEKFSGNVIIDY